MDWLSRNLAHMSEEYDQHFQQDIKIIKTWYRGRWDVGRHNGGLLLDRKRDSKNDEVARKVERTKFMPHTNQEKSTK